MENKLTKRQVTALVTLRILIGWHFLFEGVTKLYSPFWTSKAYLINASGPFDGFFEWLASEGIVTTVDYLNVLGLMAVGLGLVLGLFERKAAIGGLVLLLFYYFSQPPFPGVEQLATEGNYFLVNKNLIEAVALWVLFLFPTGSHLGVALLLKKSDVAEKAALN